MSEKSNSSIKYLDTLRGIACLIVLIAHLIANTPELNISVSGCGKIGVWLFFILSSFLIANKWIEQNEITIKQTLNFYFKRLIRIFPCYLITLLFAFAIRIYYKS